jgi:hypothetical protein
MNPAEAPTIVFEEGPRHAETDAPDHLAPVIGDGSEGGVYQRTDEQRDGRTVYRWQPLTDQAVDALVRGDLRANQSPDG